MNVIAEILMALVSFAVATVVHEFGHYLMLRHYGIKTRFGIDKSSFHVETLIPIENMPSEKLRNIYRAGSLSNYIFGLAVFVSIVLTNSQSIVGGYLVFVSELFAFGNLLPIWASDGFHIKKLQGRQIK